MKKQVSLYFHNPYCRVKCHFCAFYVVPGLQKRVEEYYKALAKELMQYKEVLKDYEISTIYAGGGTPSSVDSHFVTDFIKLIQDNFDLRADVEITTESSPETLNEEKLKDYKNAGINRLSIGLQAWQNRILKYSGRIHTLETFLEKFESARSAGFDNINVDLIFGIPTQTLEDWKESLENLSEISPEHIACYSLIVDEDSTFGKLKRLGKFKPVSDSLDRKMYKTAKRILKQKDYNQYELANFARFGFEAKHNSNMWNDNDYIGLGASAYSRFNSVHYSNVWSIEKYIEMLNKNEKPVMYEDKNNEDDDIVDHIILKLRLNKGINFQEFKEKFGRDFNTLFKQEISKLKSERLIRVLKNSIKLTSKGQDLENLVGMEFV